MEFTEGSYGFPVNLPGTFCSRCPRRFGNGSITKHLDLFFIKKVRLSQVWEPMSVILARGGRDRRMGGFEAIQSYI